MEIGILGLLLLAAAFVTYWVSRNRGYPGFLFAILALLFPVMVIIVFFLPDKSKAKKREEIDRAFERSLEKQQKTSVQHKTEVSKPAAPKAAAKSTSVPRLTRENITADQVVLQQHAMECYRSKNYSLALPYFVQLGEAGHLDSQMYAAQMYYHGQGCAVHYEKALYWYERAAELGQPIGQSNTAKMYKDGIGCTADPAKALYWYEKAAEQGDDNAQLWAGMLYELGQGCTKDTKKARYWYEKAAAQGNADAKKLLSNMND